MQHAGANPNIPANRLIALPEVVNRTGLSRATIYRYVAKGIFPRPMQAVAHGAVRWSEGAVNRWIEDKTAEANAASFAA